MRSIRIITAAIVIVVTGSVVIVAQRRPPREPIPRGTSTIRGGVFDSVTNAPVAGCSLEVNGSGHWNTLTSGEDGAYELKDIVAGEYYFNIECPAHLMICINGSVPPAPTREEAMLRNPCVITVVRDQRRDGTNFHVTPGAIARGQVVGFDGRPVAEATVKLGRGMNGEPAPFTKSVKTDDHGRFELLNAPAGEWRLEVLIPPLPGGLPTPIVYYPGGLSWEDATGVELIAGKIHDDLVITMPRINENSITVAVPPPDGTISEVAVSVLQPTPLVTRRLSLDVEGTGTLKGVLPGRYFVVALGSSGDMRWAGFEVVDFVEDNYIVRLQLLPTGSIAGKIIVERGAPPDFDGVMAGASWVYDGVDINPADLAETNVAADGSFRIDNLYGTRKLQLRALGVEWDVAAIRQDRSDVTESGITIIPGATVEATVVLRRRQQYN